MEFKDILKGLRNERELKQSDLAKIIGVTRPTITKYETGTREPDFKTLIKLADYFDCSIDYLLGRVDNKKSVEALIATTDIEKLGRMTISEYVKLIDKYKNL